MKISFTFVAIFSFLTACTPSQAQKSAKMPNPTAQYQNLTFECRHEARPSLSPQTQQLYLYALYHDLHNMWNGKKGDEIWQKMAALYRIAAYNGDYKANLRLQWLIETGRVAVKKPQTEVYLLNKELEKQLPATVSALNPEGNLPTSEKLPIWGAVRRNMLYLIFWVLFETKIL